MPMMLDHERLSQETSDLADKIDVLLVHDEQRDWMPGMREFCVDAIFAAVHRFATLGGIDPDNTNTRLELAVAIDSQIRFSDKPNPFITNGTCTPDYIISLPRQGESAPTDEEVKDFFLAADNLRSYAESARKGLEELACLGGEYVQDTTQPGGVYY